MHRPTITKRKAVKSRGIKRTGRPGKAVTRDGGDAARSLAQGAMELFTKQNYSSVSIKDISVYTGVNTALIYYYFGSKEGLFLHVVEASVTEAFQQFEAIKSEANSPIEIISLWIEIHVIHFIALQQLAKISLDYATTSKRTRRVDDAVEKFYREEAIVLENAIKTGIAQGLFRLVDPREVAVFISTFLDGSLFRAAMLPKFNHKTTIRFMRDVILSYLRKVN